MRIVFLIQLIITPFFLFSQVVDDNRLQKENDSRSHASVKAVDKSLKSSLFPNYNESINNSYNPNKEPINLCAKKEAIQILVKEIERLQAIIRTETNTVLKKENKRKRRELKKELSLLKR